MPQLMFNPISTYRIQFNKDFTLRDFEKIIPYLQELGIRTVYASPIFEAVPGSDHGYDTTNPNQINPEIGTLPELERISKKLKAAKISWIQDIVPNHMAFHHNNLWLMDVLKNGESSTYRQYFDIISKNLEEEPLMVPFLGEELNILLERDEIVRRQIDGEDWLTYYDSRWPVRPGTDSDLSVEKVLDAQHYRLCSYKESNDRMNYRRFFTVNSLICLNMQEESTFQAFHHLIKKLVADGIFQGLRIDHIDGLADPEGYLQKLRTHLGKDLYIVAEKILEPGEELPRNWSLQGTTGYDFLGLTNQVLTNHAALPKFDQFYNTLSETTASVDVQIRHKKKAFLLKYMKGELDNLSQLFASICPKAAQDLATYKKLIAALLVRCPVYRYYGTRFPLAAGEQYAIKSMLVSLRKDYRELADEIDQLEGVMLGEDITFYKRLMQFTGPLMAKGVEDTLMYTFNRFIGSNEVGDSPEVFGIAVDDFHQEMIKRQQNWPLTLNASATHDTKRGEDARARLEVLTSMKNTWFDRVEEWRKLNSDLKQGEAPDPNDEYFIYQTLVATYPDAKPERETFASRIQEYLEKALRESKRNSNWDEPDLEYERHTKEFILGLLDSDGKFWPKFLDFLSDVTAYARMTSLAATVLKYTCPGVPDLYQGTELWDYSLVDPDNRRPVDYTLRAQHLRSLSEGQNTLSDLWPSAGDGRIKLLVLQKLLGLRNAYPDLFEKGQYIPLQIKGQHADAVIAFARRYLNHWLIVVLPLNLPALTEYQAIQIGREDWASTALILPNGLSGTCTEEFNGSQITLKAILPLQGIFGDLPLAILQVRQARQSRGAGVLMHISSLPSAFGIGDFGPGAHVFLDWLAKAGQTHWQLLPMNPVSSEQSYSPYSSTSVMAGNVLFISPELLVEDGLLDAHELKSCNLRKKRKVSYPKAEQLKRKLLHKAYQRFRDGPGRGRTAFDAFCTRESHWLEDYALFSAIKHQHAGAHWYHWPEGLRDRQETALASFCKTYAELIDELKWQQFIFDKQWNLLRSKAEALNIKMIGDLPFYASADSSDVWTNREFFKINPDGQIDGLAGVPPDYFNEEGQLWGMPVYHWLAIQKEGYRWWMARIRRNLQLYDYIRLDHFRAFAEYWEIPASAGSAKEGSWQKGPGAAFFKELKENFGDLPLIAEDLGEITEDVYALRDQFELPGMKVLQFGFGADHAESVHAPHRYEHSNCWVYTGTHDNNTIRGWYDEEADQATKTLITEYLGYKTNADNVSHALIRLAYAAIADVAIIPLQDFLKEGSQSRMNIPSSTETNWLWKLKSYRRLNKHTKWILKLTKTYGR
jgi:malto-oligosyltrehalose synthase/4-alpha-glucanotransferase